MTQIDSTLSPLPPDLAIESERSQARTRRPSPTSSGRLGLPPSGSGSPRCTVATCFASGARRSSSPTR
jgi:hypothetical protein